MQEEDFRKETLGKEPRGSKAQMCVGCELADAAGFEVGGSKRTEARSGRLRQRQGAGREGKVSLEIPPFLKHFAEKGQVKARLHSSGKGPCGFKGYNGKGGQEDFCQVLVSRTLGAC